MDELRELVAIVTKKKLKAFPLLPGKAAQPGVTAMQLYDLIAEGKVKTDEEAMLALYEGSQEITVYQRTKNALWEYLLQMLMLIDLNLPHYNARQKAYFECYRNWAAAKILIGKNAHRSTLLLASELLRLARKFDFTDLALDVARSLRLYYGSIEGDLKKYEQYGKQVHHLEDVFRYENLAEEMYTDLVIRFVNDKSAKKDAQEQARKYFREIEPALEQYDSYRLHFTGRLIEILIATSVNDYKKTVEVCDKAIRFFETKTYVANVPLQVFLYQEMVCCVQLRDYQRGQMAAARGFSLLEEGAFNWFKYQELLLLLSLHTRQHQDAYRIYSVTVQHRRFGALPGGIRQVWKIFEAYLYYLHELKRLEDTEKIFNRFRMARFLNETPIFSRDKRGLNIPILIFQIQFLILNKRYDETIDRIEAIEKYTMRYLKKDDNFRSNCFIKMLLQIAVAGFHKAAVARYADKFVKQLKTVPLDLANQSHDIEIIPYEDLWQMALDSLDNTIFKPSKR